MAADAEARSLKPAAAAASSSRALPNVSLGLVVLLLMGGHLLFGANRTDVALEFALLQGVGFLTVAYLTPWGRAATARWSGMAIPAVLFAIVLAAAALAMTPFAVGGVNPLWSYVPKATPAAVLDRSAVFIEMMKLGGLACVFGIGAAIGQEQERARRFLHVFLVASALYAAWALVSHLADSRTVMGVAKIFHRDRLTASFLSANTAATLLGYTAVLTAALLVERIREATRNGWRMDRVASAGGPTLIALGVILVSVLLTASRAGFAATAAGLTLFALWELFSQPWRRPSPRTLVIAGGALVIVLGLALTADLVSRRFVDLAADAAVRNQLFDSHWRAFKASPWSGYGLGNFYAVNRLIENAVNYKDLSYVRALHNVYIQWLEEGGLTAALPMFACIGWVLVSTGLGAHRRRRMTMWMRALVAASVVILIHGATDYALQVPSITATWACLLGLGLGLAKAPRGANG
jgi:O-antigen ligase